MDKQHISIKLRGVPVHHELIFDSGHEKLENTTWLATSFTRYGGKLPLRFGASRLLGCGWSRLRDHQLPIPPGKPVRGGLLKRNVLKAALKTNS